MFSYALDQKSRDNEKIFFCLTRNVRLFSMAMAFRLIAEKKQCSSEKYLLLCVPVILLS